MHRRSLSLLFLLVGVCLLVPHCIEAKSSKKHKIKVTTVATTVATDSVDNSNQTELSISVTEPETESSMSVIKDETKSSTSATELETESSTSAAELETESSMNAIEPETGKPSSEIDTKKKDIFGGEDVDDNDEEGEEDEEEEEETCDMRLSTFARNFNTTPYVPDEYQKLYESVAKTNFETETYNVSRLVNIVQSWFDLANKMREQKDLSDTGMYISSVMSDRMYEAKVSPECMIELAQIGQALRDYKLWPAKFIDASGGLPTGMLRGHISVFGEYDQCLGIKSPLLENGKHIYGKYCHMHVLSVIPKVKAWTPEAEKVFRNNINIAQAIESIGRVMNMDKILDGHALRIIKEILDWVDNDVCFFHVGICVPSSCSTFELELIVNQLLFPLLQIPFQINYCETHQELADTKLEKVQCFAIIFLCSIGGIVFLCTLYHIYLLRVSDPKTLKKELASQNSPKDDTNNNNNKEEGSSKDQAIVLGRNLIQPEANTIKPVRSVVQQFVLSFSVLQNTNRLRTLNPHAAPLNGLMLLLTFFLYTSQAFTFPMLIIPQLLRSIVDTVPYKLVDSEAYWFARTPSLWVDGFILALGIAIVQSQFAHLRITQGRFGFFEYLWRRWYRLSVSMFGVILLVFLFPLMGDGPMWFINKQWLWPACSTSSSLFSTFLYYSNWNPTFKNYTIDNEFYVCNPPSWFFSVSTQLYLLAPVFFIPMYRWPTFGVTLTVLVLLLSPIFTLTPHLLTGGATFLEWTRCNSFTEIFAAFHQYHSNTLQYVTPLLIGLLTGYMIETKPKFRFGGVVMQVMLYLLCVTSVAVTFVWNNTFWKWNQENSQYSALAWFVSSKFMFSGALAYVAYMCCTGRGGLIHRVLSCPVLQSVGKLSYGIYLLSALTILNRFTPSRHTYEMYFYQTMQNTVVDFILTILLSYCMYLLFEGPSICIMTIFESDRLFSGIKLENTDSVEELKQSSDIDHSSDNEKNANNSAQSK